MKKKMQTRRRQTSFFCNNGAAADNRDNQTAFLTAENPAVKVIVLVNTGSECSAIPRNAVQDARKGGWSHSC
jgi:hypothetical protein